MLSESVVCVGGKRIVFLVQDSLVATEAYWVNVFALSLTRTQGVPSFYRVTIDMNELFSSVNSIFPKQKTTQHNKVHTCNQARNCLRVW